MRMIFLSENDTPGLPPEGEVHLWTLPLAATHEGLLTDEEKAKAARYTRERTRHQFACARGQLRFLLSNYLQLPPKEVGIRREPSGKPYLDPSLKCDLQFNVSHSEALGIYAFVRGRRVGVDVEQWRDIPNKEGLIERFCTAREKDLYCNLPEEERESAFFRLWTRKEAALKAIGRGVQSLDQCDVTFCPGEEERVLRMEGDNEASGKWFLRSWRPTEEYVAAVAVELKRS